MAPKVKKLIFRDDDLMSAPSSVDRLSPFAMEMGCFGKGDPSAGRSKIKTIWFCGDLN